MTRVVASAVWALAWVSFAFGGCFTAGAGFVAGLWFSVWFVGQLWR